LRGERKRRVTSRGEIETGEKKHKKKERRRTRRRREGMLQVGEKNTQG
jgi:hypothetical protein